MTIAVPPRTPALAPFVRSLRIVGERLPSRLERMVPTGDVNLLVNLDVDEFRMYDGPDRQSARRVRGAVLAGPRERHAVIDTEEQRWILMVHFRFGGATPFFTAPQWEMANQFVELDDLWGDDGAVLRERLLEAATDEQRLWIVESALLERVVRSLQPDPAVALAVAALERGASVSEVASRLGLLPKTLARRFRDQVGLLPKRFSRVRRLQQVLSAIEPLPAVDWAETAVDHGYFDQAHLVHDFQELVGTTPTAYRQAVKGERNHVPLPA